MTAYAAAISLLHTIGETVVSPRYSVDECSKTILLHTCKKLQSLIETLERLDGTRQNKRRKNINAVDEQIKEVLWRFEDLLESHLTDQIHAQSETHQEEEEKEPRSFQGEGEVVLFSIDLQGLQNDVDSFFSTVDSLEKKYIYELENMPEEEVEEEERIGFGGKKSKMVGLSHEFQDVKNSLMKEDGKNPIFGLVGMAGIGKTTLAEEIFEDPEIQSHFEHRVWVTVGRKCQSNEYYPRAVLSQLDPDYDKGNEMEICKHLKGRLEGKKCLIVLDDVWEAEVLDSLMTSLPEEEKRRTLMLVTARDRNVISGFSRMFSLEFWVCLVRFMNEEESTELLCKKVFGEEGSLPSKLEKAAKKIAKKCEGLPLLILAVADHLSKVDTTEEYWNEVAEERNTVFKDALEEISKVLFPSYEYLPQYLKMFFLYLGVFHPDCEITPSNLINMLRGEGWSLDPTKHNSYRGLVSLSMRDLSWWRNLVLFNQPSKYWYATSFIDFKNCRLHCSWRHLCQGEAWKDKFYRVLNGCVDSSEEFIKGPRCLCLHNNILLAIEDVHDSVQLNCASSARSLLCFGPYHQYPVPIDISVKLLRVLDALNLCFYTFPIEILKLVRLKYLALTCDGEIPATISKLFNLRVLIIRPHTRITTRGAPSYIPIQIWDMKKLEHIEILGKSLPPPPSHVASLDDLSTLLGMSASIYTILELSKKFPRIRKLGIQIELTPYDEYDTNLLNCLHSISSFEDLEILKCSIVNLEVNRGFVAPATPISLVFPIGLVKLHLSGMGFPWEYMDAIASLPNLEVLKLRSYAFRGPKWDTKGQRFLSLKYLLIEDSDLVQLSLGLESFPKLRYLSMKHCNKLQDLHWPPTFRKTKIEFVDCNPLAISHVKELQARGNGHIHLTISSSYNKNDSQS